MVVTGLAYMIVGMGVVFAFLVILVYMMQLLPIVVNRFCPEAQLEEQVVAPAHREGRDQTKIAAMASAIKQHQLKT